MLWALFYNQISPKYLTLMNTMSNVSLCSHPLLSDLFSISLLFFSKKYERKMIRKKYSKEIENRSDNSGWQQRLTLIHNLTSMMTLQSVMNTMSTHFHRASATWAATTVLAVCWKSLANVIHVLAGIILRSQLANFSQFWSKFCHPWDQCKSGEKRFSLYYTGGSGRLFMTACPTRIYIAQVRFSRIFARPEWCLTRQPSSGDMP